MKLPTTPLGWGLSAAGAVVALLLIIFVLGRFGISWDPFGWAAATHEQDRVGNIAGKHQGNASADAAKASDDFHQRQAGRDALTQENRDDVLSQPDAGSDAGRAGDAGLRSLCKRPEFKHSARCVQLSRQGSAVDPR